MIQQFSNFQNASLYGSNKCHLSAHYGAIVKKFELSGEYHVMRDLLITYL